MVSILLRAENGDVTMWWREVNLLKAKGHSMLICLPKKEVMKNFDNGLIINAIYRSKKHKNDTSWAFLCCTFVN